MTIIEIQVLFTIANNYLHCTFYKLETQYQVF